MSRFVINVSKNGDRFFSTSRASIGTDAAKAGEIVLAMQAGFPEAAGYKIECYFIETTAKATLCHSSEDGSITPDEIPAYGTGNLTFTPTDSE